MSKLGPLLAAIASGLILTLAYPRWDFELAVWIWMLPLLAVLWGSNPASFGVRHPFLLGYLAGLAFFVPNLFWVRHSSRVIFGALDHRWIGWGPELLGLSAAVGLAGYCALYFGLWAWFAARAHQRRETNAAAPPFNSLRRSAVCAAAWCGCEWLRGIVFTGFGWNGLGVALHQNHLLAQGADLIGVTGLSFLPVFVSCSVAAIAQKFWRQGQAGLGWSHRVDLAAALLLIAGASGYGLHALREQAQRRSQSIPLHTVLVQQNIPQTVKWSGEHTTEIYQGFADLTRLHAEARDGHAPVDLVIWPESSLPFPLLGPPPEIRQEHEQYFNAILSLGDFSLLTGAEILNPGEPLFTSAVLFRGTFANQQHYHKVHLVPFGEYLPFRNTFPFSLLAGILPGDFAPGQATEPLKLERPRVQIIPLICFEDTVGRVARRFVRDAPQLIVNLTNDGWFLQSSETEIHLANSIFRAIELRRPMVRAANTGVTCVIDECGRITDRLADPETGSTFIEGCLQREIAVPEQPPRTVYAGFGDWFSLSMLGVAIVALAWTLGGGRTAQGRIPI